MKSKFCLFVCVLSFAIGALSGWYWTSERFERAALARFCGSIDKDTLAFTWADEGIIMVRNAAERVTK